MSMIIVAKGKTRTFWGHIMPPLTSAPAPKSDLEEKRWVPVILNILPNTLQSGEKQPRGLRCKPEEKLGEGLKAKGPCRGRKCVLFRALCWPTLKGLGQGGPGDHVEFQKKIHSARLVFNFVYLHLLWHGLKTTSVCQALALIWENK